MKTDQPKMSPKVRLEKMIATLRDEIDTGKRLTGEFIPSELNLCEQFELSRNSVRKGLDVLVAEGYVEKVERVGTKVKKQPHADAVKLVFGMYSSMNREVNFADLIQAFHRKYPNIHVQMIDHYYSNNWRTIIDLTKAKGIDVMLLNNYHFEMLAGTPGDGNRLLEPLAPNKGIYPFLSDYFTKEGSLLAQPFIFSPVILCYNKDHFRAMNLSEPDSSWTWEDVREAGRLLSNGNDRYGLYFHVLADNRWPLFLLQSGARFNKKIQEKYQFGDPKVREGLKYCMTLIHDRKLFPAYLSQNNLDVEMLFLKQKVSMIVGTYNSLNSFIDAPFDYDIAPLPYYRNPLTLLSAICLAVSRESKQQVAAKLFVDYLVSEEAQLYLRKHTLNIPALKKAAEWSGEEAIANRPGRFQLFREIMPTYRFYSELNLPYEGIAIMRDELKFYWSGLDDLDTVLARIEEKLNGNVRAAVSDQ